MSRHCNEAQEDQAAVDTCDVTWLSERGTGLLREQTLMNSGLTPADIKLHQWKDNPDKVVKHLSLYL
ncbi:hypothetical protein QQF64_024354 [Cirrhinus molitorella]|uniref:Uncharacterized protein n=1 Tax=Cirrhinus molitorella TaxID=172907 RepID=A0ABR3NLL8_9TELE